MSSGVGSGLIWGYGALISDVRANWKTASTLASANTVARIS